jgi:hypothetical protein
MLVYWLRKKLVETRAGLEEKSNKDLYIKILDIKPLSVYAIQISSLYSSQTTIKEVCLYKDYQHDITEIYVKLYQFEKKVIINLHSRVKDLKITRRKQALN